MNKQHRVVGQPVQGSIEQGFTVYLGQPRKTQQLGSISVTSADTLLEDFKSQMEAFQAKLDAQFPEITLSSI